MNSLYQLRGKDAIFRSKVKWIEQGENQQSIFFNLEKKNYVTKTLLQIKLDNGEITSDMKKINKHIELFFFSETYKSKLTDVPLSEQELGLNDFTQHLEIPPLSNKEQATFEHDLTVQEIKNVLHSFEKTKLLVVHRIIMTKKELLKYKLASDNKCPFCLNPDSTELTFLYCPESKEF